MENYIKKLNRRRLKYLNHKSTDETDIFNYRYNIGSAHRLFEVITELKQINKQNKNKLKS